MDKELKDNTLTIMKTKKIEMPLWALYVMGFFTASGVLMWCIFLMTWWMVM